MAWSFSIGRLFGSELKVHVTFFILLGWIAMSAYAAGGLPAAIVNTIFILALFACVVAHEFGHALMARRYGIRTPDVTLLPIGGLARLDRMPENPREEIAVALAGPAVNLVIWALLTLFLGAATATARPDGTISAGFLDQLATINLYLMAFNLLPAFPMDGGRVLRAILSWRMGRARGTRMAALVGQGMAVLMGLAGLALGQPILILIAAFVFFAAQAESSEVGLMDMARKRRAADAMITDFRALKVDDTLSTASEAIIRTTQHEFPVVDPAGRPIGYLPRQTVFTAIAEGKTNPAVGDLMLTDIPVLPGNVPLSRALDDLRASPAQVVLVAGPGGKLAGYITRENLAEMLLLR